MQKTDSFKNQDLLKMTNVKTPPKMDDGLDSYYTEVDGKIILSPDEKIFDTSWAIEPVLIRLEKLLFDKQVEDANTILLSMNTVIRNSVDKNLPLESNIKRIGVELNLTIERIKQLYESVGTVNNPYLVIYITNFRKQFDEKRLRPLTPGKTYENDVVNIVFDGFENEIIKRGDLTINFVKITDADYGEALHKLLKGISKVIPNTFYTGLYYLVSHLPMDFHVLLKSPNGSLISCHTGEVLTRKNIGSKVFADINIPFNQLTHGVLGDKYQLLPTVKKQSRLKVKQLAETNHWLIRTEAQIKQDLRNIGIFVE